MCVSGMGGGGGYVDNGGHADSVGRRRIIGSFSKPTYLSDANANVTFVCTTSSLCAFLHR